LGDIFSGTITKWNDPKIAQLNPGATLPEKEIIVVHRADGSGTTFLFSHYLFQVSDSWKKLQESAVETPGKVAKPDSSAKWPANSMGGKGNEGVAGFVKTTPGSIGYVEYAYAQENNLSDVALKNQDGIVVEANIKTFTSAAASADWGSVPGYGLILTNQAGPESWPITGASFILLKKGIEKNKDVQTFFDWAFKNGEALAKQLNYVPLPADLIVLIEKSWSQKETAPASK
jgi:phosphate transport system substrate-binding protein